MPLSKDDATTHQEALTEVGFDKVCFINKSYQVIHSSDADSVPSAWNDSEGNLVNENQELANDWAKATSFKFFKGKFNVIQKSAVHIVGQKGKHVIVAKMYKEFWVVAHGKTKGMGAKKGAKGKFANAPGAFNEACKALFDALDEDDE